MAAIVVVVTGVVLAVSLMSPERYRATARIADDPAPGESVDIESADRRLATSAELVTSPTVLEQTAQQLPGESLETLERSVSATVDPSVSSILDVAATGEDPQQVALIANTTAETFIVESRQAEQEVAARARERLADELERLRETNAPVETRTAVRERLSELAVTEVTADSGLRLVQRAAVPSGPYAPQPIRSVVLAFFSALLLGVLIAILRDHVRPPVPDAATLARMTGLPVLAALPAAPGGGFRGLMRRLFRRSSQAASAVDQTVIEEAALQGAVRGALPPRGQRVVLVHAIDQSDAGTQVAEALARSLAWGGHPTVLVRFERQSSGRPAPRRPGRALHRHPRAARRAEGDRLPLRGHPEPALGARRTAAAARRLRHRGPAGGAARTGQHGRRGGGAAVRRRARAARTRPRAHVLARGDPDDRADQPGRTAAPARSRSQHHPERLARRPGPPAGARIELRAHFAGLNPDTTNRRPTGDATGAQWRPHRVVW